MNLLIRHGLAIAVTLMAAPAIAQELETEDQKLSYMIGMDIGASLNMEGTEIDLDVLFDAIRTTFEGGTPKLTTQEAQALKESFIAKRRALAEAEASQLVEKNGMEGEAFLANNQNQPGVIVTSSGLQYKVVNMGSGPMPSASDTVEVHYRGTFLDGREFDSSYSRNQTAQFPLNGVIAGWTEGLQLMPVGSTFEFFIKPELGYGRNGRAGIPPNATLLFTVELVAIK